MNMDISQLKTDVKDLVEAVTNLPAFYDFVPLGTKKGVFLNKSSTVCSERTIEGSAVMLQHEFHLMVFDFTSETDCDDVTSALVNAIDSKRNAQFQQIQVQSVDPIDYDEDYGFYSNVVSAVFVTYG